MDSRRMRTAIVTVCLLIFIVAGLVLYMNRGSLPKWGGAGQESVSGDSGEETTGERLIGSDTRAFLKDETFFDQDSGSLWSVRKKEENRLSLLMTSVQKDLRIQIVDSSEKPVKGIPFAVTLNEDKEYNDSDEDGIIYIEFLRAGTYQVSLKEVEGYQVPDEAAVIQVKPSVEYAVIDDISLLMFTEDQVDPALEDLEVKEAIEDADSSEITKIREGNASARFGIDVSKWNKEIDWDKAKKAGVEFAIVRVGYRGATTGALIVDPYFEKNMKGAAAAGIPLGVYFFTQAMDTVEAVEEASMVVRMIQDYKITYPVFIDTESAGENGRANTLDQETRTAVCRAFCMTIENEGYKAGVYAARNWMNEKLDMKLLGNYITWLAEYRDVPVYQGFYHMWQYTSKGKIDGIEGNVDLNLSYLTPEDLGQDEKELQVEVQEGGVQTQNNTEVTDEGAAPAAIGEEEIVEPKPIRGAENAEW